MMLLLLAGCIEVTPTPAFECVSHDECFSGEYCLPVSAAPAPTNATWDSFPKPPADEPRQCTRVQGDDELPLWGRVTTKDRENRTVPVPAAKVCILRVNDEERSSPGGVATTPNGEFIINIPALSPVALAVSKGEKAAIQLNICPFAQWNSDYDLHLAADDTGQTYECSGPAPFEVRPSDCPPL